MFKSQLAFYGGQPTVTIPGPHEVWPPKPSTSERYHLGLQRQADISIAGSSGPVGRLEENFKKFLDNKVKYSISFNSGTSALLAAYVGVGIQPGDEVLCPSFTYHAAVTPLWILGAKPIPVDICQSDWCLDPTLLSSKLTPKTKAITVVHQWGHPAQLKPILDFAKRHNLRVIEDCSHAHGARYNDQPVGTFGDVAVFSLQAKKIVFAGEGGILVTNSSTIHDRAVLLGHYRDRAKNQIINPALQKFWVTGYGLKLRISPYNAITALYSLQKVDTVLSSRHKTTAQLTEQLSSIKWLTPPQVANNVQPSWYGYKVLINHNQIPVSTAHTIELLQTEGLEVDQPSSLPFSQLPLFTTANDPLFARSDWQPICQPGDFPVAESMHRNSISLPIFSNWPEDSQLIEQYVAGFKKIDQYFQGKTRGSNG